MKIRPTIILLFGLIWPALAALRGEEAKSALEVSILVDDKEVPFAENLNVSSTSKNLSFLIKCGATTEKSGVQRIQYKLHGFDSEWREPREPLGMMSLNVRFFDADNNIVGQKNFPISNISPGWRHNIQDSKFTHRRESFVVPARAKFLTVVISSAGPPVAVGIYVVADLTLQRYSPGNSTPKEALEVQINPSSSYSPDDTPANWIRDGTHPAMAKLIAIGTGTPDAAVGVIDNDPISHAEWRLRGEFGQKVTANEHCTLEWNEVYNIGLEENCLAIYGSLTPGKYRFQANGLDFKGEPLPVGTVVNLTVIEPFWKNPWLWGAGAGVGGTLLAALINRRISKARAKREFDAIKQQHLLEAERLRIARNIHDDLGARLTHISLISENVGEEIASDSRARAGFFQISGMARELVASLYETVWSVNPENDHLHSLVDFLCELIPKLCGPANVRCRIKAPETSFNCEVSSEVRHNVILAVKEAVHNIIKHSGASDIVVEIKCVERVLLINIRDCGKGFIRNPEDEGHGIKNMFQRMQTIGGRFAIESTQGEGTSVRFEVPLLGADHKPGA